MKLKGYLYKLIIIAAFVVLWQISSHIYNSAFFPGPLKVLESFIVLLQTPSSYIHTGKTFLRVSISVLLALIIGSLIGILPKYSKFAKHLIKGLIYPLFHTVPVISWSYLVAVWFGLSNVSVIFILLAVTLPIFIINVFEGMKEVDEKLMELGSSFTDNKIEIAKKIILPSLYPYLFSALRKALGTSWKVVLIAEIFASTSGVGYLISLAAGTYDVPKIMAWTIVIVIMILIFDYGIFKYLDMKTMRKWKDKENSGMESNV